MPLKVASPPYIVTKAFERLLSDVLSLELSPAQAIERGRAMAELYGVRTEYIEGYLWGRLVGLAIQAQPGKRGEIQPSALHPRSTSGRLAKNSPDSVRWKPLNKKRQELTISLRRGRTETGANSFDSQE